MVPHFLDWTPYKPRIENYLSSFTGLNIEIKGDLDVRMFPEPGVVAGNVSVSKKNAPDTAQLL